MACGPTRNDPVHNLRGVRTCGVASLAVRTPAGTAKTTRVFVDETKAKRYMVVAAFWADAGVGRRRMRGLVMPGQRSLHMKAESDSRRHEILGAITDLVPSCGPVIVYDAGTEGSQLARRAACLDRMVRDCASYPQVHVTLDLDASLVSWDRQRLIDACRAAGVGQRVTYEHRTRSEDALLAVPDAIAWAWARGGEWRKYIRPVVCHVPVTV